MNNPQSHKINTALASVEGGIYECPHPSDEVRLAGVTPESLVDGPGIRFVIFAQGCDLRCEACHNPESWDKQGGNMYSLNKVLRMMKKPRAALKTTRGVTFSGGDPMLQADKFAYIATRAKKLGWDVVTYTGQLYEDLIKQNNPAINKLLDLSDYLIDGPYLKELRDLDIKFRGSSNQRIIDLRATKAAGYVITIESFD